MEVPLSLHRLLRHDLKQVVGVGDDLSQRAWDDLLTDFLKYNVVNVMQLSLIDGFKFGCQIVIYI